jgi:hypothetical protein
MLYAILICSDPDCAEEFEASGEPADLDKLACDCGCSLQAIAFDEVEAVEIAAPLPRLRPRSSELRHAA